ncbi:hypothetical protein C7974DRAFT_470085 [Boeremia exigua]|uniref:uncharacterized protein n=1 Tax=Boeremia exigua TaxID=749465 RepID=UPI001E8E41D8|nr:uncharacterized protein C7974DRAFT_470085 [Boeremia exigua]KAH6639593.1 hypothetical protein C7974DRAFT_470085 [Boeremia exigua]
MQLSRLLFGLSWLLLPVALAGTAWLYLYPLFHGCAFPAPSATSLPLLAARAPFRLLALGDPQLEGDSSLPDPSAPVFPSLQHVAQDLRNARYDPPDVRDILLAAAHGALGDAAAWLEGCRKAVDLWGNDWYLAHIVRSLRWWTEPTHVAVLGDLLGSQWVSDGEFERRAGRYWGTVMRGLQRVPDAVMGVQPASDHYDDPGYEHKPTWGGSTEVLGADPAWAQRVINIAGNHDIGYAGDIDAARVSRFERAFGAVNWDLWLTLNTTDNSTAPPPALRLIVLNTMNLDTPALTPALQDDTYAFLNHLIASSQPTTSRSHASILLTHIPLHKRAGLCADAPFFDFFESGLGGGVREQNMLSEHGSRIVLESVFGLSASVDAEGRGLGRAGVVLNGHDHEGCDVLHWTAQPGAVCEPLHDNVPLDGTGTDALPASVANGTASTDTTQEEREDGWRARLFASPPSPAETACPTPQLREITLRSMMGEFGGHAGFLSAWWAPDKGEAGEWVLEFASCGAGVQHWWWGVHAVDLVVVVGVLLGWVARGWEVLRGGKTAIKSGKEEGKVVGEDAAVREKSRVVHLQVKPGAKRMAETQRA